ncbi:MAG: argininosuccinate lyase, partial [Clostridia bacterium]|nr:argininosuccinate lyase [Clostridia bacterium]
HTARSRNDQVALDIRMYLRDECEKTAALTCDLIAALADKAEENTETIMPGYTHLQRAQPVTFGHYLLAYAMMLARDLERIKDAKKRMNFSPLGCCALAGTTYPIDRDFTAAKLGFDGICLNSIDGVSDRDFAVEICSALSICMMHLSRLAEELILWSSWEFSFIELDDAYTTGSSIMPQKKNSDMAELVRGKTGRVYGDLSALLTMLKGLPLAYNKDMQEDKEAIFDAVDTAKKCLAIMTPMISTMKVKKENMYRAAQKGFINATDCADYLVGKGTAFRTAYKLTGELVAYCVENGLTLDEVPLDIYKSKSELFESDVYEAIKLENCVKKRTSAGGCGKASTDAQLEYIRKSISDQGIY